MDISNMVMRCVIEEVDDWEPLYKAGIKENILFQLDDGNVIIHWVDSESPHMGLVACENDNGCLDYMIECQIPDKPKFGYFIMEGAEVSYSQDYWGECDVDLYCKDIRPAVLSEIPDRITPRVFWEQLVACWLYARQM